MEKGLYICLRGAALWTEIEHSLKGLPNGTFCEQFKISLLIIRVSLFLFNHVSIYALLYLQIM